jgi:hypothetical protein
MASLFTDGRLYKIAHQGLRHNAPRPRARRPTASVNASTRTALNEFYRTAFRKKVYRATADDARQHARAGGAPIAVAIEFLNGGVIGCD